MGCQRGMIFSSNMRLPKLRLPQLMPARHHRRGKTSKLKQLIDEDVAVQLKRLEQATQLQPLVLPLTLGGNQGQLQPVPVTEDESPALTPNTQSIQAPVATRPRPYFDSTRVYQRTNYQRHVPKLIQ